MHFNELGKTNIIMTLSGVRKMNSIFFFFKCRFKLKKREFKFKGKEEVK